MQEINTTVLETSEVVSVKKFTDVLKSKRFITGVIYLVSVMAHDTVGLNLNVDNWTYVVMALIAGYSIQDWINAFNNGQPAPVYRENDKPVVVEVESKG